MDPFLLIVCAAVIGHGLGTIAGAILTSPKGNPNPPKPAKWATPPWD